MAAKKISAVYLRVSTLDQEKGLKSQEDALREYIKAHRVSNIKWYRDRLSGATLERPAFERLQRDIFAGKVATVVVWKLDRISRSMRDGVKVLADWCERGVRVVSVTQQLDFNSSVGQLIASVLYAVGQMERENLSENVKRGLRAAEAKGVKLGRPQRITAEEVKAMKAKGLPMTEVAKRLKVTRQACYEALKRG